MNDWNVVAARAAKSGATHACTSGLRAAAVSWSAVSVGASTMGSRELEWWMNRSAATETTVPSAR